MVDGNIYDFMDPDTVQCPKCHGNRVCFSYRYEYQLVSEPRGLTVTCRCGYYWYERAADYQEPETDEGA